MLLSKIYDPEGAVFFPEGGERGVPSFANQYCADCYEQSGEKVWVLDLGQIEYLGVVLPANAVPVSHRPGNSIPLAGGGRIIGSGFVQEWCPACGRSSYMLVGK